MPHNISFLTLFVLKELHDFIRIKSVIFSKFNKGDRRLSKHRSLIDPRCLHPHINRTTSQGRG